VEEKEMNSYELAKSLGLQGDDKTQFAVLQSLSVTHNRIAIGDLLFLMRNRGMMIRLIRPADTGEKWGGTLTNLILFVNANGSPEQVAGVNKFFSHITDDRSDWFDTTDPSIAGLVTAMRVAFQDKPGMPTSDDFDSIAALGGGFVATTLDDFTALRVTAESQTISDNLIGLLNEVNAAAAVTVQEKKLTTRPEVRDALIAAFDSFGG
jgi:hypothetical protein